MTTHTVERPAAAAFGAKAWARIGLTAAAASIAAVLAVQALATAVWPDIALFNPLDSLGRSAVFTLVPAIGATAVFAGLARRSARPESKFITISAVVLLISVLPDYALPVPHKTLLASTVTAFLHVVAGVVTVALLIAGYRRHR